MHDTINSRAHRADKISSKYFGPSEDYCSTFHFVFQMSTTTTTHALAIISTNIKKN